MVLVFVMCKRHTNSMGRGVAIATIALLASHVLAAEANPVSPHADTHSASTPAANLSSDPILTQLIAQSLAARPEIASAKATVQAERERIPQAGVMPDPMLQLEFRMTDLPALKSGGCLRVTTQLWPPRPSRGRASVAFSRRSWSLAHDRGIMV